MAKVVISVASESARGEEKTILRSKRDEQLAIFDAFCVEYTLTLVAIAITLKCQNIPLDFFRRLYQCTKIRHGDLG